MLLSSRGTSRASSEHDVHRRMELSPGAHRSPAQEEMSPLPAAQPGADGRLSPRLLLSGGSVQLAHADTLLFQFAFWPAINISKNSCRDGFLFSFPFFFFFFKSSLQDRYPFILHTSSCLSFSCLLHGFCTNTLGEQPPFCAPSDNTKISGALKGYSQMDAAPDPWRDASASPLGGFGVTKQWLGMESTVHWVLFHQDEKKAHGGQHR